VSSSAWKPKKEKKKKLHGSSVDSVQNGAHLLIIEAAVMKMEPQLPASAQAVIAASRQRTLDFWFRHAGLPRKSLE
jgi:acetyl/propionyl-CoA carboxylase alpha subunit